jgi:hypothetical protein
MIGAANHRYFSSKCAPCFLPETETPKAQRLQRIILFAPMSDAVEISLDAFQTPATPELL